MDIIALLNMNIQLCQNSITTNTNLAQVAFSTGNTADYATYSQAILDAQTTMTKLQTLLAASILID